MWQRQPCLYLFHQRQQPLLRPRPLPLRLLQPQPQLLQLRSLIPTPRLLPSSGSSVPVQVSAAALRHWGNEQGHSANLCRIKVECWASQAGNRLRKVRICSLNKDHALLLVLRKFNTSLYAFGMLKKCYLFVHRILVRECLVETERSARSWMIMRFDCTTREKHVSFFPLYSYCAVLK